MFLDLLLEQDLDVLDKKVFLELDLVDVVPRCKARVERVVAVAILRHADRAHA